MAPEVAEVMEAVKSLTHDQRADLAYQVLLTLDEDKSIADQAEVEGTWALEIRRRVDDYHAGRVELLNLDESHAQLRAELAASR